MTVINCWCAPSDGRSNQTPQSIVNNLPSSGPVIDSLHLKKKEHLEYSANRFDGGGGGRVRRLAGRMERLRGARTSGKAFGRSAEAGRRCCIHWGPPRERERERARERERKSVAVLRTANANLQLDKLCAYFGREDGGASRSQRHPRNNKENKRPGIGLEREFGGRSESMPTSPGHLEGGKKADARRNAADEPHNRRVTIGHQPKKKKRWEEKNSHTRTHTHTHTHTRRACHYSSRIDPYFHDLVVMAGRPCSPFCASVCGLCQKKTT